ncbi:MAG: GGDEF domain-containing protein [Synergistaceae bacterium]|nr:GGDEF domain-containing protein [Synergistaceae bacterium]
MDAEGFKAINDQYGHPFGDAVFRLVGTLLDGIVSEGDLVVRFGGDEFVLLRLFPDGEMKTAAFEAAFRHFLNEERSLLGRRIRIGASIGRSLFPEDGTMADDLLRAADEATDSQKRRGPLVTEILGGPLRCTTARRPRSMAISRCSPTISRRRRPSWAASAVTKRPASRPWRSLPAWTNAPPRSAAACTVASFPSRRSAPSATGS